MIVKFNVPVGSGLSVSQCQDGTVDLYIKASFQEELSLEMDEETAVKVGYALLKMTGSLESSDKTKGGWLEDSGNIACSHCHTIWLYRRTDFCPNCGADMRGDNK